jgi:hypothetical protein
MVKPDQFLKIIVQAYKNVQLIPRESWLPHRRMIFLMGAIHDESSSTELTSRDVGVMIHYGGFLAWDPRLRRGVGCNRVIAVAIGLYTIPAKPSMVQELRTLGSIPCAKIVNGKPSMMKRKWRYVGLGHNNRYKEGCHVLGHVSDDPIATKEKSDEWFTLYALDDTALAASQTILIVQSVRLFTDEEMLMCDTKPTGFDTLEGIKDAFEYVNDEQVSGEKGRPSVAKLPEAVANFATFYSYDENLRDKKESKRRVDQFKAENGEFLGMRAACDIDIAEGP